MQNGVAAGSERKQFETPSALQSPDKANEKVARMLAATRTEKCIEDDVDVGGGLEIIVGLQM